MPSKRTNDSVDRILEDLNIQQAQAGLRDSVTDHQVDEILRSVGISTAPAQPVQGGFAFEADDDLDALLNDPGPAPSQAAPAPRPVQPAPQSTAPQARPAAPATQPPRQDLPMADTGTTTFSGDTTGTGIIKGFLVKMAPDGLKTLFIQRKFLRRILMKKYELMTIYPRPVREIIKELNVKLVGHYRYYGVTWNYRRLCAFLHRVQQFLFKAVNRRGCRRAYTWGGFWEMLKCYPLAKPKTYYCLY